MDNTIFIYKTNGFYFGFIRNGFLFSRDGIYMGWIEGDFVWDAKGRFRGTVTEISSYKYIIVNKLSMSPAPKMPKLPSSPETPPISPANIVPINLSPEFTDGFNGNLAPYLIVYFFEKAPLFRSAFCFKVFFQFILFLHK